MNKLSCVIDTSAIISLEATSKFQLAEKLFSFVSTGKVKDELIDVSKTVDEIGLIANNVLRSSIIKFILE